jgi:hypothetical protein
VTLEQYAFVFEILGSVAVVISLVFVGIQLARANRESRSATTQAAMFREMDNSFRFAEFADTWDKIVTAQPLQEGAELRTAIALFNAFMTDCEYRYREFKAGHLDAITWEARNSTLPALIQLPIFPVWRAAFSGRNHASDFLAHLEDMAGRTV